jgi:hypothetical protein
MESAGSSEMSANFIPDYAASHLTMQKSVNAKRTSNLITVNVTSAIHKEKSNKMQQCIKI